MRVLLVHDKDLGPLEPSGTTPGIASHRAGGTAVYLRHLEAGLRDRGCQTSMARFTDTPQQPHELKAFRHRVRPSVITAFERLVEREDPDVVHLHAMPMLHPLLVRRLLRARPVVWTFHDVHPFCFLGTRLKYPDGGLCERRLGAGCVTCGCFRPTSLGDVARLVTHPLALRLYRSVPALVVPSRYMADVLLDHGIAADRTEIVPLFSRFDDRSPAASPPHDTARILFVGRLSQEKGILALVDALALLRDRDWTARIVGDGPLRDEARRRVIDAGLESRVAWPGELGAPALAAEYAACSLLVVPSVAPESFGLVGVEAMSFGKPVVAFEAGGIVEWLADDVNGFLAPRGNIGELAARIARLVDSSALRDRLGRDGRQRALAEFTLARHVDRITKVYESVLGGRSVDAL